MIRTIDRPAGTVCFLQTALCALSFLLVAGPSQAQTPGPNGTTIRAIHVGNAQVLDLDENSPLRKRVQLVAEDMPVTEAFKAVLTQADIAFVLEPDIPDTRVTLTVKNVPLSAVLSLLAREAGVGVAYERSVSRNGDTSESKLQVRIGKKLVRNRMAISSITPAAPPVIVSPVPPIPPIPPQHGATATIPYEAYEYKFDGKEIEKSIERAMKDAERAIQESQRASRQGQYRTAVPFYMFGTRLPDVRVRIDRRNADVRDSLKDVLKQANLNYAIEDDVPGEKRSFTFDNIPIGTALDVICQSVGAGWRAERTSAGKDGQIIVRIGKKCAGSNSLFFRSMRSPFSSEAPLAQGYEVWSEADEPADLSPAIAPLPFSDVTMPTMPLEEESEADASEPADTELPAILDTEAGMAPLEFYRSVEPCVEFLEFAPGIEPEFPFLEFDMEPFFDWEESEADFPFAIIDGTAVA